MQEASARTEARLGRTTEPRFQGERVRLRLVWGQAHFGRHAMDDLLQEVTRQALTRLP